MENVKPLQIFNFVNRYFWTVLSCPIKFINSPNFSRKHSNNTIRQIYYFFKKNLSTVVFSQFIRLIAENLWKFHLTGEFDNGLFGTALYLIAMEPSLNCDFLFWNTNFNLSLWRLTNLLEKIWLEISLRQNLPEA